MKHFEIIPLIIMGSIAAVLALRALYLLGLGAFALKKTKPYPVAEEKRRFCAVVAARNEEPVIGSLIRSLQEQNYPHEKLDIVVLLNNCTDDTRSVSLSCGARVYDCRGKIERKGEALAEFFATDVIGRYDAFCVFDADNLADRDFISRMNDALNAGVRLAQGFKDSKNPSGSWVAGCSSLYFRFLDRFVNGAAHRAGLSCFLLGTGMMISADYLRAFGYQSFTLIEDIELTMQGTLNGETVAYVREALTYDEQPEAHMTSWIQRKRWSSGMEQCVKLYGAELRKQSFSARSLSAFNLLFFASTVRAQVLIAILLPLLLLWLLIVYGAGKSLRILVLALLLWFVLCTLLALKLRKRQCRDAGMRAVLMLWFYWLEWIVINALCRWKPETEWKPIRHFGA